MKPKPKRIPFDELYPYLAYWIEDWGEKALNHMRKRCKKLKNICVKLNFLLDLIRKRLNR